MTTPKTLCKRIDTLRQQATLPHNDHRHLHLLDKVYQLECQLIDIADSVDIETRTLIEQTISS